MVDRPPPTWLIHLAIDGNVTDLDSVGMHTSVSEDAVGRVQVLDPQARHWPILSLRLAGRQGGARADSELPRRATLLPDEPDALFGRRPGVRDSHDRYANIEVSYLLKTTVSQQHTSLRQCSGMSPGD
jgi:hypothetical protein